MSRKVFTLRLEMDNDAFSANAGAELARILREQADEQADVAEGYGEDIGSASTRHMTDVNGNRVGEWIIAEHRDLKFTR